MLGGEPIDPESRRVGRGTGNLKDTELGSGRGKTSHTYGSGRYEEGSEKGYRSVITNTDQAGKKPSIMTTLFEMVDHGR